MKIQLGQKAIERPAIGIGQGRRKLFGDLTTAGGSVTINSPVRQDAALSTIDTTNGGGTAAGADVTINGTINGDGSDDDDLTINAGTGGSDQGRMRQVWVVF